MIRKFNFVWIYVFLYIPQVVAEPIILDIYPVITVVSGGALLRVDRIAKIQHGKDDAEVAARIKAVELSLPIDVSQARQYLKGADVKKILLSALVGKTDREVVVIARPTLVVRIKTELDISDRVRDAAKNVLIQHLQEKFDKVKVKSVGKLQVAVAGDINAIPRTISSDIQKRMVVWVDIFKGEILIKSVPVWFNVSAVASVLALNKSVVRGEKINASHFIKKRVDISELSAGAILNHEGLESLVYSRDISKGKIVRRSWMRTVAAVNFGDKVSVLSRVGGVEIRTTAVAQGDADIGERVKLILVDGEETFWGKVVGVKEIVVEKHP